VRRNRREIPVEREQELLSAFIEAYGSSETRVAVDRFLRALFSARKEPSAGHELAPEEPASDRKSAA
jgi:hypothetical protein